MGMDYHKEGSEEPVQSLVKERVFITPDRTIIGLKNKEANLI